MVLNAIDELATGFEGCEKKVEIDFHLSSDDVDLRVIPRDALDSILDLAKCTIISVQRNVDFDAYVLSESSLFIYPSKIMLKTCGTTLLLKCVSALLSAARSVGAQPDFLQFSRSNFLFPSKQHFPHRAFTEETDYLNEQLAIKGDAFILGSLNGARWHLYIWDFNALPAQHYQQQTLEVIMFNLNTDKMKTFYKQQSNSSSNKDNNELGVGHPCVDGEEATRVSGIDQLLPGSVIDSHLFTPCGYSCNGRVDVKDIDSIRASLSSGKVEESKQSTSSPSSPSSSSSSSKLPRVGKQGKHEQAYFTIHITPEPECSFVSFETNAVLPNYTPLVRHVVDLFQPGSFCVSLFVDGGSDVSDSRSGLQWEHPGYVTKGTTHHAFQAGYNATVSQFEAKPSSDLHLAPEFGAHALNNEPTAQTEEMADETAVDSTSAASTSLAPPNGKQWGNTPTLGGTVMPFSSPRSSPLSAHLILSGLNGMPTSYETVTSLSQEQMRAVTLEVVRQRHIDVQHLSSAAASPPAFSLNGDSAAAATAAVTDGISTSTTSSSSALLSSARSLLSTTSPDVGFTVVDLGAVARRFHSWSRTYPRVEPVYSLSAPSLPAGMAVALSALGFSFAVHSSLSLQHFLNLNIPASRLLFHLPLKSVQQLSYAHSQQVYHINASATSELHAIKQVHDSAKVWLHVKGKDADGIGFDMAEVAEAVQLCKTLELSVEGVHVDAGSVAESEEKEEGAHVRQLVDVAVAALAAAAKAGEELSAVHLDVPLPSSSAAAASVVQLLQSSFPADVRVLGGARSFFDSELALTCVRVLAVQPARQSGMKRVGYVHSALSTAFSANKRCKLQPFSADSDSAATGSEQPDMVVSGVECVDQSAAAPTTATGDWLHTYPSLLQLEQLASKGPDAAPCYYIAS